MTTNKNNVIIGAILIILGVMFFFRLDVGDLIGFLWPLVLILIGLYVLVQYKRHKDPDVNSDSGNITQSGIPGLFGDIKVSDLTDGVGSIERMLLFGDISIDLTNSKLLDGDNFISVSALFGDLTIITPDDFVLWVNLGCCAGDITFREKHIDGLFVGTNNKDENYDNASARLLINAKLCFGDIKVINTSNMKE
ncbi:MAG: cell wall-active antibiotics response protein [candidate division Zixibacteria bacterium]|nr:cell wall-active antibiotics response protein [candidate division Zixibacteria bacterium]